MKFQHIAAALLVAATSVFARIPSQETMDKARRLAAVSQPYIVQVSPSAITYVENILLPQLRQMSGDNGVLDFFANVTRNVRGSAFNGLIAHLSPAAVQYLSGLPIVTLVEPDIQLHFFQSTAASPPPAPAFTEGDAPWHLDRIDRRPKSYDDEFHYTQTGEGVDVYIIDSGINTAHTEFTGRIQQGANFQPDQDSGDVEDCNGHGTHVSALAAGTTYGAAKKANIIPVRIYGCDNAGPLSQALEGINFVLRRMSTSGRRSVINMSFGGEHTAVLDAAVRSLTAAGGVVIVAAGNEAADACGTSPAGASEAFAVGASDKSDNFADFSNYGSCVSLVAPGVSVKSAWIGSSTATQTVSGTSMASPITAGVAAGILQAHPDASVASVRTALKCSATGGVLSGIPTSSTPDLLLYSPPGGFQGDQQCVTSGVAQEGAPLAVAACAVALAYLAFQRQDV